MIADANDGKIDVSEYHNRKHRKLGYHNEALAKHIGQDPLTSTSQYRANMKDQVERQLSLGIIPNISEIRQDPLLDPETKNALIKRLKVSQHLLCLVVLQKMLRN